MNCGECLANTANIVELVDLVCPKCGASYREEAPIAPAETPVSLAQPPIPAPMKHFVSLVLAGRNPGCSGGEHAARELAKAIAKLAPLLDDSAVEGAARFLRYAPDRPQLAKKLAGLR